VSLGSVLVYEAPLIKRQLGLKASAISASILRASVAIDDAPSSVPEISEDYSSIRPAVDDMDILLWHARLGHLFVPGIKRLTNAVRGIQHLENVF